MLTFDQIRSRPAVAATTLSAFRVVTKYASFAPKLKRLPPGSALSGGRLLLHRMHFAAVVNQLLTIPVPLPKEGIESFVALVADAEDKSLAMGTVKHLYEYDS